MSADATTALGRVSRVELREAWRDEARDFTPWLADNLDLLGEALGMRLEVDEREAGVGEFSLDLLATDAETGRTVVVENQFGKTNHDHLGKLLTYAAGLDAAFVVLVAESIRDEHRQALEWLNEKAGDEVRFFAVALEVVRIDHSRPAPVFRPVVTPNEWRTGVRRLDRETSPRREAYRRFFKVLVDELREEHRFTGARVAQPLHFATFASGARGVKYGASFAHGGRVRAEVYIDRADADGRNAEATKAIFDELLRDASRIEREFGEALEWERLEDRRASRIATYREGSIDLSPEVLDEIRRWIVDRLLRLKKVFGPRLGNGGRGERRGRETIRAAALDGSDGQRGGNEAASRVRSGLGEGINAPRRGDR
jgi:hypothetical protein